MSLVRLGSAATRRQQTVSKAVVAKDLNHSSPSAIATTAETETATERAFEPLVQYFPTETITLFLAAISVFHSLDHISFVIKMNPLWLVAAFTILTPLMVLLVAYATFRESQLAGNMPPEQRFKLPVFDLIASAVAFVPWALAVPGLFPAFVSPPDQQTQNIWTSEIMQVFAAFLAFSVSWFLSQLRRIIGHK
ncbi:MAG: hypothetical protein ACSHYC_18300 [Alphaproteobacteria bacterium]